MGWLRDLMAAATPPVRSFDALAEGLLSHVNWPAGSRLKQRSLSALLSKIDRGIELDWLTDRTDVQHITAERLGCALGSIQQGLGLQVVTSDEHSRRFRFDDVRFARPLDLASESLPPGLPLRAQRPTSWKHLWWQAPAGSGRSLLGRWLQARGLCRFEVVPDAAAAERLLRDGGEPLFVEIIGTVEQEIALAALVLGPLAELKCCVACDAPPPSDHWEVVHSPAAASYLPELLSWLSRRLPQDGNFDEQQALHWLQRSIPNAWLGSFGVVLGLLGLIDEFGVEKLRGKTLENVARAFVTEKLRTALEQSSQEAQWLRKSGFEVLLGLTHRALLDSASPWGTARNESDWVALVPPEFQHSVDAQWVQGVLSKSAISTAAAKEVQRALGKLQPGAFRIVRSLQGAGLLRAEHEPGMLSLAPHWLARTLQETAWSTIAEGSVLEWGEALLLPHTAARMMAALSEQFANDDFSAIEEALELDASANPAHVAAVEACFRAAGLCLLQGGQIPAELLQALYEEQRELVVQIGQELPRSRIEHTPVAALGQLHPGQLHAGLFYLSALAISAELPEQGVAKNPVLHPFAERAADERLLEMFSLIEAALDAIDDRATQQRWYAAACTLVARLAEHFAAGASAGTPVALHLTDAAGEPHPLEWPSLMLKEIAAGDLHAHWLQRLCFKPQLVPALQLMCEQHKADWPKLAHQLWQQWQLDESTDQALALLCGHAPAFWPFAPTDALVPALLAAMNRDHAPYSALTPAQWLSLKDDLPKADIATAAALFADAKLWQAAPLEVAWHWLEFPTAVQHLPLVLPLLWQRDALKLFTKFEAYVKDFTVGTHHEIVGNWLHLAPSSQLPELTLRLRQATLKTGAPLALVDTAREFLHRQIAVRAAGFRDAYELLSELEQRAHRFAV